MPFVGELSALSAACLWGASSLIFAAAASQIGPIQVNINRNPNPLPILIRKKNVLWLLLAGSFLGAFLGVTLSLIAIANTKVGIASTLLAMSPVAMLPMVKFIKREVLSWKAIVGAFVAVSGVAILFLT